MSRDTFTLDLSRMPCPPEDAEALRRCAVAATGDVLTFDVDSACYRALAKNFRGRAPPRPRARIAAAAAAGAAAKSSGPGDVVKLVLSRLGYAATGNCGCEAMRRRMNEWGYLGCWRHRAELVAWFTAKAKEAGVDLAPAGLWKLLRQAWREKRSRD